MSDDAYNGNDQAEYEYKRQKRQMWGMRLAVLIALLSSLWCLVM